MEDWYNVSVEDIKDHGGVLLLKKLYKGSLYYALSSVFPDHSWLAWKFSRVPFGFWDSLIHQKAFFDWLGKEFEFSTLSNWYQVTKEVIDNRGGNSLLSKYDGSPAKALRSIYPEHEWIAWKFNQVSPQFWANKENHKKLFDQLEKELNIQRLEDWYRISLNQISKVAPITLFKKHGMSQLLLKNYPQHSWDLERFNPRKGASKSSQRVLTLTVQEIFPKEGLETLYPYFLIFLQKFLRISIMKSSDLNLVLRCNWMSVFQVFFWPSNIRANNIIMMSLILVLNGLI